MQYADSLAYAGKTLEEMAEVFGDPVDTQRALKEGKGSESENDVKDSVSIARMP